MHCREHSQCERPQAQAHDWPHAGPRAGRCSQGRASAAAGRVTKCGGAAVGYVPAVATCSGGWRGSCMRRRVGQEKLAPGVGARVAVEELSARAWGGVCVRGATSAGAIVTRCTAAGCSAALGLGPGLVMAGAPLRLQGARHAVMQRSAHAELSLMATPAPPAPGTHQHAQAAPQPLRNRERSAPLRVQLRRQLQHKPRRERRSDQGCGDARQHHAAERGRDPLIRKVAAGDGGARPG